MFAVLSSCSKQDANIKQVCDTESEASFTIHTYEEFLGLNSKAHDENSSYSGNYQGPHTGDNPEYASWYTLVLLKNICNTDLPNIEFSVKLKTFQPYVNKSGLILEDNNGNQKPITLSTTDGINFYSNINFQLSGVYNGSKGIYAELKISTEYKGSYKADKDFFISILSSMSCTIKAHKPQ